MRVVVQRVNKASVTIDDNIAGKIEKGLLLLVAVHKDDGEAEMKWAADKIAKLRIFQDDDGKMNKSVLDTSGELLVVSQFTLYGDVKKGTRPSFIESARPEKAERMYADMIHYWRDTYGLHVETGQFGAMMQVELINDGPVTVIVEKNRTGDWR